MVNFTIEEQLTGSFMGSNLLDDIYIATTGGILGATFSNLGGGNDIVIGNNDNGVGILGSFLFGASDQSSGITITANGSTIGMAGVSILTEDGNDTITATGGSLGVQLVSIDTGAGNDTMNLQSGTGTVNGGRGIDTLTLEGDRSDYTFSGENGSGNISGSDGTDLDVENIERFVLNGVEFSFDDLFSGDSQNVSQPQLSGPFTGTDQDDSYEATSQGIVNASFNTLAGNDTIIGESDNIADGSAILDSTISTGDNDDTITATATGSNSIGLNNVTIQLGMGNDLITAQGTFLGVQDVSIDGGGGNDIFELKSGTGQVLGGDGNDTLNLFGLSTDYTFTDGDSSNLSGKITGANGTDLTVDGIESFQFSEGVFTFDELFNQPVSIIQAQLTGEFDGTNKDDSYFATTSGIVNASFNTLEGSDTIMGMNSNSGGTGISNTSISSGDGGDTIVAMAMGADSIGMDGVTIQAGLGNDVITAQGTLLGVQDVLINGGEGSDTFDLGSGTGIVVGGIPTRSEIDLLILDGQSSDYTFSGITNLNLGRIINDDFGTNLTVFSVDEFRFSDGTFAFDELFGETPPPSPDPSVVSIAAIEQEEGDSGTTEFVFDVTRTGDDSEAVTVDWEIGLIPGQADANDFVFGQPANGDVTILAGETSAEVVIEVQGDTDFESNERFTVTLSNPSVGIIDEATATGTIINDDEEPTPPEQGDSFTVRQINDFDVEGTELSDFYEVTQSGIFRSTFNTLEGNDSIISNYLDLPANFGGGGAITLTDINTGEGDDTITAEAEAGLYAIDLSRINTGDGKDIITGLYNGDQRGTGIGAVTIQAGNDDDLIIAGSDNLPIDGAIIDGGDGNDIFELRNNQGQNGRGTIIGNTGDADLLIMVGTRFQFFYDLQDSNELMGRITENGGNTILDVKGVENFQFEDGSTFTFEELFAV